MASRQAAQITRQVKPLLSLDKREARQRVLGLYRAWWRQIPFMHREYLLPFGEEHSKKTLKAKFMENAHVKDIRVIDMLVIKGQQDLKEVVEIWAVENHILSKHFKITIDEKPKDFLSKFLSGQD